MFVDTHAHLNFHAFSKDSTKVIQRAHDRDIGAIIIPGANLDSSQKAIDISEKFPQCFAAIGIHPHHFSQLQQKGREFVSEKLTSLSQSNRVVAMGEIGLDSHVYQNYPPLSKEDKKIQIDLFELQIEIAKKRSLPVIIHNREAQEEILSFLRSHSISSEVSGVFHCFEGDKSFLRAILNAGFYIGFDGNCTYKANQNLRDLIKMTPLDRLLLETDSPFLTPEPHRGERNEPAFLVYIANLVCSIHTTSLSNVADITTRNAISLFRLPG